MSLYFSQWTATGLQRLRASMTGGPALQIATLALGDGAGAPVDPTNAIALVREVYRGAATVLAVPNRTDQIMVQLTVPQAVGNFTASEMAAIDTSGAVVAVGSMAPTQKLAITSGAPNELVIRMYLTITATANVSLVIDPSMIGATQSFVNGVVVAHKAEPDPHPSYVQKNVAQVQFAAFAHTHAMADITGLSAALAAKTDQTVYVANLWTPDQVYFMGT